MRPPSLTPHSRLRAGLRRLDVVSPDDFEEEEYSEAGRGLGDLSRSLVSCCRAGWHYPWGLRVRLVEVLLGGAGWVGWGS